MSEIKAIPTEYAGVTFRSRTEARWAVFFDGIGLRWEYEPEGYQLDAGWYLPDFWLPEMGVFAEVKPETGPTPDDLEKILDLASEHPVAVLSGAPWPDSYQLYQPETAEGTREVVPHGVQFSSKYGAPGIQSPHDTVARFYYGYGCDDPVQDDMIGQAMEVARAYNFLTRADRAEPVQW